MADKTDLVYTVAYQHSVGGNIDVYKMRSSSHTELMIFMKRVLKIGSVTDAAFLEVHCEKENGQIDVVYGDMRKQWPKNVRIHRHEGILAAKPQTEVIDVRINADKLPVITKPTPLIEYKPATETTEKSSDAGLVVTELRDKDVAWIKPLIIKVA